MHILTGTAYSLYRVKTLKSKLTYKYKKCYLKNEVSVYKISIITTLLLNNIPMQA